MPGCVVGVVGPPGIGKSRIMREAVTLATGRGVEVFTVACESHTRDVPFRLVARLLRTVFGVSDLDEQAGRARVRARIPDANPEDLLLLDDLLGIGDPDAAPPAITADARRRRLAALLNAAALARTTPALYVIEDVHWIDEVSEAMLAEFVTVVPQSPSLVLITYRPEYRGALSRTPGAQTISLAPLNSAQTAALTTELLGTDPSVRALARGSPSGPPGTRSSPRRWCVIWLSVVCSTAIAAPTSAVMTPPTSVCRPPCRPPSPPASTASVGRPNSSCMPPRSSVRGSGLSWWPPCWMTSRWPAAIAELLQVELIDQVMFTPRAEYAFRHPLIRAVAYESQLKSGRAELHRRLAVAIEEAGSRRGRRERRPDRRKPRGCWGSARGVRLAYARRRLVGLPRHSRGPHQLAAGPPGRRPATGRRPGSDVDADRAPQPAVWHPVAGRRQHRRHRFRRTARVCAQRLTTRCRWRSA